MKSFSITDIGQKRQINQDYIFCSEAAVGAFPNLFLVADGMGGHKAGDFASRFSVEEFVRIVRSSEEVTLISKVKSAISLTNSKLLEQSRSRAELEGMGTTFVVAFLTDNILHVANIGDSRLYVLNDTIEQITEDHSLVEQMIKNGDIKREEARFHPNKNIITRALGISETVVADFFELPLMQGDIVLMCSDGLSNMLDDSEILSVIKNSQGDLKNAAETLVEQANQNGGKDNISSVLIFYE